MRRVAIAFASLSILTASVLAQGQTPATPANQGEGPPAITIDRQALTLRAPESYRISLSLKPVRTVRVSSRMEGVVSNVYKEVGQQVTSQEEVARLEQQQRQLELDRAKSLLRVAQLDVVAGEAADLIEAKTAAARNFADLAQLRFEETQVRAPFAGTVLEVFVQPGDFVRAGSPVLTLVDGSVLTAVIPVERGKVKLGETLAIPVEGRMANVQIAAILPPPAEFEPLRELFNSLAAAQITLDNKAGEWALGQALTSDMMPRQPIAEIPNRAVLNAAEGVRKIQVLREGFVRDLPVQLLGNVGDTHVFVSARFQAADELIVTSSQALSDGTWLRPMLEQPVGNSVRSVDEDGVPVRRPPNRPTF